jgi:hypothetical protein
MTKGWAAELARIPAVAHCGPKFGDFGYIVRHSSFGLVS